MLLNRGDDSFRAKLDYKTGKSPNWIIGSIAIGDLKGDGKPDLLTPNYNSNTVSVLLNSGDGSFQAKQDYATVKHPESVAIGNLNGDSKPDLATAAGIDVSVIHRCRSRFTATGIFTMVEPELLTAHPELEVQELRQRLKETVAQTFEAWGDAHEGVECDDVSG